ncbi:MAG: hypothetical protein AAFY57_04380 [Cyanobacteria bacterium J06642_2]
MVLSQFVFRVSVWLISEIVLGFLGCDHLADYGESMAIASEGLVRAADFDQQLRKVNVHSI